MQGLCGLVRTRVDDVAHNKQGGIFDGGKGCHVVPVMGRVHDHFLVGKAPSGNDGDGHVAFAQLHQPSGNV